MIVINNSFYVKKNEQNYASALEAFGLARVISRLSGENVDVKIINRGWAYEIYPLSQIDYSKLLSCEVATKRFSGVRSVQKEPTVRFIDKTGTLMDHPALGQQSLSYSEVRDSSYRYANNPAPSCSAGRLMAAWKTQSLGYQELLKNVSEIKIDEFVLGLAELLDSYRQPGKQNKSKKWPFKNARCVQILSSNKLAGVWGEKVTCTKKFQKNYLNINIGQLWLTTLGYYQASIAIVSGGDVQLMVVEPQEIRLHSVTRIVDDINRFAYALDSFNYASAYAVTQLIQLFLEREEQIQGIWSTIYLNKGQGSVSAPVAFKFFGMPAWLSKTDKEKKYLWYWHLQELMRPVLEVSRAAERKVPPRLLDDLSVAYINWLGSGNIRSFFNYIFQANLACQQQMLSPEKYTAPSIPVSSYYLTEVIQVIDCESKEYIIQLLNNRKNNGFDEVSRVLRSLTVGGVYQEMQAAKNKEYFRPPLVRHDLLSTLLNLVQNPPEFCRYLQEAIVRYNELATREYAKYEVDNKKEKPKGFWYQINSGSTKWLYEINRNYFADVAMLLLAEASCKPKKEGEK